MRNASWQLLIDPSKKGRWWLPPPSGAGVPAGSGGTESLADVDADVANASEKILQLAASQRMNTEARRAIFCQLMDSGDYLEASEKLLSLKLPGKQVGTTDIPPLTHPDPKEIKTVLHWAVMYCVVLSGA